MITFSYDDMRYELIYSNLSIFNIESKLMMNVRIYKKTIISRYDSEIFSVSRCADEFSFSVSFCF